MYAAIRASESGKSSTTTSSRVMRLSAGSLALIVTLPTGDKKFVTASATTLRRGEIQIEHLNLPALHVGRQRGVGERRDQNDVVALDPRVIGDRQDGRERLLERHVVERDRDQRVDVVRRDDIQLLLSAQKAPAPGSATRRGR